MEKINIISDVRDVVGQCPFYISILVVSGHEQVIRINYITTKFNCLQFFFFYVFNKYTTFII